MVGGADGGRVAQHSLLILSSLPSLAPSCLCMLQMVSHEGHRSLRSLPKLCLQRWECASEAHSGWAALHRQPS